MEQVTREVVIDAPPATPRCGLVQRVMPNGDRAHARIGRKVGQEPLFLRGAFGHRNVGAGTAAARVQHYDVPGPKVVAVIALSNLSRRRSEIRVIAGRIRTVVFVIARRRPVVYMKHAFMKYIGNLLDWADELFRRDTMESINEATGLYVLAYDLLGRRPERMWTKEIAPVGSDDFMRPVAALLGVPARRGGEAVLLNNGDAWLDALLADFADARRSITFEPTNTAEETR